MTRVPHLIISPPSWAALLHNRVERTLRAGGSTARWVLLGVVLVALIVSAATVVRAWNRRAPYGADAMHPHITVATFDDVQTAQKAVDELVGPDRLTVPERRPGTTLVVGTLNFRVTAKARAVDQQVLFVLDPAGTPVQDIWGVAPTEDAVVSGWDGRSGDLAQRYSWLSHLRAVPIGDGEWKDPGSALGWRAATVGPVTFVALVPDVGTAAQRGRVTFALALLGNDRMHGATRVSH